MSRSCYTDDYGDEFPGQLGLYRGNVDRSIRSKNGQARLVELRKALEALPVKALEAETFIAPTGEVCALGAWAQKFAPEVTIEAGYGDHETAEALQPHQWPRLVVLEAILSERHRSPRL